MCRARPKPCSPVVAFAARVRLLALMIGVSGLVGCVEETTRPAPAPPPLEVPAGFSGVLPCADCPGIRTALLLRADRMFLLRQTWLGRDDGDSSLVDVGRWRWRDDAEAVLLDFDAGTRQFGVTAEGRLRPLDRLGQPLGSGPPAELLPADVAEEFTRPWRWRGMYRELGGEGLFHDCGSRLTRPVQPGDAFETLAGAYARAASTPGAWLLITLRGHLVALPPAPSATAADAETAAPAEALRVTALERVWPSEDCGRRGDGTGAVAGLEDTVWWLTDISGAALPTAREAAPRIRMLPGSDRLEAFGGCNVILGDYFADATSLVFSDVSTTYKECASGLELERRLVQTLRRVDGYAVDGGELRLYAQGRVVARFTAASP